MNTDHQKSNIYYIPAPLNPADPPSQVLSLQDAKLSPSVWSQVRQNLGASLVTLRIWWLCCWMWRLFGWLSFLSFLHTQLLVLLRSIFLLSFQLITVACFLIPQVLHLAKTQSIFCPLVAPDILPRKFWWPLLQSFPSFLLAPQGRPDIVCSPSAHGFSSSWPLPWDLWVFCIVMDFLQHC